MAALTLDEILNSDIYLGRTAPEIVSPSIASPVSLTHDPIFPVNNLGLQSQDGLGIIRSDELFVTGRNTKYTLPQVDAYTIPSSRSPFGIADRTGSLKVSDRDNIFANGGQLAWSTGVQNPEIYLDRIGSVLNNYGQESIYGNQGLLSEPPAIGILPYEVSYPTETLSLDVNGREKLLTIGGQPAWSTGVQNPEIYLDRIGSVLNAYDHGSMYANDGILSSRSLIDTQAYQAGISGLGIVENETRPYAAWANIGVVNPLQNLVKSDGTLSAQASDHDNIFVSGVQSDCASLVQIPVKYNGLEVSESNIYGHGSMYANDGILSSRSLIAEGPIIRSYEGYSKTISAYNLSSPQGQIVLRNQFQESEMGLYPHSFELPISDGAITEVKFPLDIDYDSSLPEPRHPIALPNKFIVIADALETLPEKKFWDTWEDVWSVFYSDLRSRESYACLSMRILIDNINWNLASQVDCDAWAHKQSDCLDLLYEGRSTRRAKWLFIATGCGSRKISENDLNQTGRANRDYRELNRIHKLSIGIPRHEVEELLIRQGIFLEWLISSWSRNLA